VRVAVVDDDADVRGLLCAVLGGHAAIEVVGDAPDGAHAATLADRVRPDVIVMDFQMPQVNGVEATRRVLAVHPDTEVIGFSSTPASAEAFLAAGARRFFDKRNVGRLVAYVMARAEAAG
jgi:chemotaxis response regulator CheB